MINIQHLNDRWLLSGRALIYKSVEGELDHDIIDEVVFNFEGGPHFKVACSSDGESVSFIEDNTLSIVDMGDWGEKVEISFGNHSTLNKLVLPSPCQLKVLCDAAGKALGIELNLASSGRHYLINCGDNLALFDKLPSDFTVANQA